MSAPTQTPDLQAVKGRQQVIWSAGDYSRIGNVILITAELLCETMVVHAEYLEVVAVRR